MLRAAARALGAGIVFLAALVLGFMLHLRVPAVQRAVVARVNAILAPVFAGTLTIDRVGALGLPAIAGIDAHMDDPEGKTVIRATGIAGRASVFALLRSIVSGDIIVGIPEASLATAEVNLDTDAAGTPRIANAFLPRTPSNPSAPGRGVRLSMPRVHLGHVTVHGQLGAAPPLDEDLDAAEGSLSVEPGKVAVDVSRGRWEARGLPGGHRRARRRHGTPGASFRGRRGLRAPRRHAGERRGASSRKPMPRTTEPTWTRRSMSRRLRPRRCAASCPRGPSGRQWPSTPRPTERSRSSRCARTRPWRRRRWTSPARSPSSLGSRRPCTSKRRGSTRGPWRRPRAPRPRTSALRAT